MFRSWNPLLLLISVLWNNFCNKKQSILSLNFEVAITWKTSGRVSCVGCAGGGEWGWWWWRWGGAGVLSASGNFFEQTPLEFYPSNFQAVYCCVMDE